ncbi:hypothetical protein Ancab_028081 [Ancistrocladus abbreviatus]
MAVQAQIYPENLGIPFCGSQDWMENTANGCGFNEFSFNLQQKQQYQQQQQQKLQQQHQFLLQLENQQQKNQFLAFENSLVLPQSKNYASTTTTTTTTSTISNNNNNSIIDQNCSNSLLSMSLSQSMAVQLEKQRQEIDRYITLQNERLRLALQEQSKQQLASFLRKLEAKAVILMRQKDEEIATATKRAMELEEFMRKMELENQLWQRVAAENEAVIVSLNTTLEQLRERAACCLPPNNNGIPADVDDAESCCVEETGENRRGDEGETPAFGGETKLMVCKICNSRNSCVLFLPCRHLCSCKACEAFVDTCPVCKSVKQASIETLIS